MYMHSLIAASLVAFALVAGCSERAVEDALRAFSDQATAQFKVERGFHVVDGQPVYLDSNASEGKITRQLPNVDPQTFRILARVGDERVFYAADAKRAYIAMPSDAIEILNADGASFELLPHSYTFARDKDAVFYLGAAIEGADPGTFTALSYCFAKDANRAYLGLRPIPVRDISTWSPLADGMAETPPYRSIANGNRRPLEKLGAAGWSRDDMAVFWGCNAIEGADPAHFVALSKYYGKDGTQVYFAGDIIPGADAASFEVVEPPPVGPQPDATDKHRSYSSGRPL